ncbi:type II and III secretion system protein family protein [Vibrio lentus]|uniref:type II and III secretion system protein family protein n=1 Tax=Vibrio lentus TaxID=136468 RepID=UPI001F52FA03|nr:pilus assembly protein N-terminal domain-containing protein [Vibrio lentus]
MLVSTLPSLGFAQSITNLPKGGMQTITVLTEIQSVFISDPEIADYQVIDEYKVVVFGKKIGRASLAIYGEEGKTLATRNIWVNPSLDHIQQQIQILHPNAEVTVANIGEQVVLSGVVATENEREKINELVGVLLEKSNKTYKLEWDFGDQKTQEIPFMERNYFEGVVNNIEVSTIKQVNVKLTIAEVSHTFLEEFGVSYGSKSDGVGVFVEKLARFSVSDIVSVITTIGNDTVGQILAEPNLSVISGETASFLVGGELPVVTVVDGTTHVEYKEYGIRLELAAKVHNDDKITLALMPEVSSLDTQYRNEKYDLPALKTRRARTTVQLGDGKSFILGGLLTTEDRETLSKVPFVSEIPVLGALFRNTGTLRSKTELLIVATVNLVKPIEPNQIQLPTMQKTTTLERFFVIENQYEQASSIWTKEVLASGGFQK